MFWFELQLPAAAECLATQKNTIFINQEKESKTYNDL